MRSAARGRTETPDAIAVSALTGEGIAALRERSSSHGPGRSSRRPASSPACATSNCCANRAEALAQARAAVEVGIPHEMLLLDLYAALRPIDAITGATTADDILNRIFSTFCIGK